LGAIAALCAAAPGEFHSALEGEDVRMFGSQSRERCEAAEDATDINS